MEELEKMNLKIAEWMYGSEAWNYMSKLVSPPNYHSDWNALMPVVERIMKERESSIQSTITHLAFESGLIIFSIADLHLAVFNYIKQQK